MEFRRRPPNPKVKVLHLEYAIRHKESEPRHILEKIVWEKDREVETVAANFYKIVFFNPEQGFIIGDRGVLLKYNPKTAATAAPAA